MESTFVVAHVTTGTDTLQKRAFDNLGDARKYGQGLMNAGGVESLWLIESPSGKSLTLWPDY